MTDPAAPYEEAHARIVRANRIIVRAAITALTIVVVVALVVIISVEVRFSHQVNVFETRQLDYHQESIQVDATLTCETAALNKVLTELAAAQTAQLHHQPIPPFTYPKPC